LLQYKNNPLKQGIFSYWSKKYSKKSSNYLEVNSIKKNWHPSLAMIKIIKKIIYCYF